MPPAEAGDRLAQPLDFRRNADVSDDDGRSCHLHRAAAATWPRNPVQRFSECRASLSSPWPLGKCRACSLNVVHASSGIDHVAQLPPSTPSEQRWLGPRRQASTARPTGASVSASGPSVVLAHEGPACGARSARPWLQEPQGRAEKTGQGEQDAHLHVLAHRGRSRLFRRRTRGFVHRQRLGHLLFAGDCLSIVVLD